MGLNIGTQVLPQSTGRPTRVSNDGQPEWMPIGKTIAWGLVSAVNADTTLDDGTVVLNGQKAIRFGTIMVPVTIQETQTVDLSGDGDPTGGTWDMTILGETLTALAWNISAANLQIAIRALPVNRANEVTVSKTGFVYTVVFPAVLGNVAAITADGTDLTTLTAIVITITTTVGGSAYGGMYAPFDSGQTDGRQTLTRGDVGILDETVMEWEHDSGITGLIEGGGVYRQRLVVGTGTQPSLSALLAVLPRLRLSPVE